VIFGYDDPETGLRRVGYYEPATGLFVATNEYDAIVSHFRTNDRYIEGLMKEDA
jgi:hypothetical protein